MGIHWECGWHVRRHHQSAQHILSQLHPWYPVRCKEALKRRAELKDRLIFLRLVVYDIN